MPATLLPPRWCHHGAAHRQRVGPAPPRADPRPLADLLQPAVSLSVSRVSTVSQHSCPHRSQHHQPDDRCPATDTSSEIFTAGRSLDAPVVTVVHHLYLDYARGMPLLLGADGARDDLRMDDRIDDDGLGPFRKARAALSPDAAHEVVIAPVDPGPGSWAGAPS